MNACTIYVMASNGLESIHQFCPLINFVLDFINLGLAKLLRPQDVVRASAYFIPAWLPLLHLLELLDRCLAACPGLLQLLAVLHLEPLLLGPVPGEASIKKRKAEEDHRLLFRKFGE